MSGQDPPGTLPYGLETIKPGAVRSMTTDKLASFSVGGTKKTAFQVPPIARALWVRFSRTRGVLVRRK